MSTGAGASVEAAVGVSQDLLAAAQAWHDAGYCVVPTHEDGSKRPFGRWKEYQKARPSMADIEAWLSTGKHTGIGIISGSASGNVELLELEGPMDAAVERLGRIAAASQAYASIGIPELLAKVARGCVEQSAGGGLHLFIRVVDGPAKGNTKLAFTGQGSDRKVIAETRGEGGFVVVAPTPARKGHPEGAAYLFINGGHPANTVEVTSEERDLLHTLFTMALDEPDEVEMAAMLVQQEARTPSVSTDGGAFDAYRKVSWRDILEPLGWTWSHRDGERDHWTRPGKNVKDGTSATTIEDGPMYVFSSNSGLPTEQGMSKGQVYAHLHHGGDLSAAAKSLRDAGYGDPITHRELPAWEAELDPDATPEDKAEAAGNWVRENLPLLDWQALWADETEEEWLVEPLLARRRLVAIYSAPKVGKSLLMLELAAAMATGREVLGNPPTTPIRTLYVDFENDPRGDIRTRLENMGYEPAQLGNLCYLSFPTIAKLDTALGADQLMAALTEYDCEAVVVDTVSRAVAGDENENDTWLNFYKHTGLQLKRAGKALIRLDHAGKDETKGQRGGSAKSGDVDAVWRMSKTAEDCFTLTCEAQRFSFADREVVITRHDEPALHHRRTMDVRRQVEDEILPKYAAAGIPRDQELSVRAVLRLMKASGITFTKGQVTKATLEKYRRQLPSFVPQTLADGA